MGYPMAGWLSKQGNNVVVYNRTAMVAERWLKEYSGTAADSPTLAVANAEIIFSCLGNDSVRKKKKNVAEPVGFTTRQTTLLLELLVLQHFQTGCC